MLEIILAALEQVAMDQDLINTFCSITHSSPEEAAQFLSISDNNIETAVSLFLESGGSQHQQRQQNELVSESNADGVREPILARTEQLVDPEDGMELHSFLHDQQQLLINRTNGLTSSLRRTRAEMELDNENEDDYDYDYDYDNDNDNDTDAEYTDDELRRRRVRKRNRRETTSDLASSYHTGHERFPPVSNEDDEIANIRNRFFGLSQAETSFTTIKEQGIEDRRFILLTIQYKDFELWEDANLTTLISDNFILYETIQTTSEARSIMNDYQIRNVPYIGIIDPRTGEQLWTADEIYIESDLLIKDLNTFLSKWSMDPGHKNPIEIRQKRVEDMTEEEQVEYAIKQSQTAADVVTIDSSSDNEMTEIAPNSNSGAINSATSSDDEDEDEALFATIKPEPNNTISDPSSTSTTLIQFRQADGTRRVERFLVTDRVRKIFAFAKHDIETQRYFTLTFQRMHLIKALDLTIEQAGLERSSILLEIAE